MLFRDENEPKMILDLDAIKPNDWIEDEYVDDINAVPPKGWYI